MSVTAQIKAPNVRALFMVLDATLEDTDMDCRSDEDLAAILEACAISDDILIAHYGAWANMQAGTYDEAGRLFARLALALELEGNGASEDLEGSSMFDDLPYNEAPVVELFTLGMVSELARIASDDVALRAAGRILANFVRAPMLAFKMHDSFYEATHALISRCAEYDIRPNSSMLFDYGLACHFKGYAQTAIEAYRSCLAIDPSHASAEKNLFMVLAPKDRAAITVRRTLAEQASKVPPEQVTDLSLKQAVFLLALYRVCGGTEQNLTMGAYGDSDVPFAPTPEFEDDLSSLITSGLVRISPESPLAAFELSPAGEKVTGYRLSALWWDLPEHTVSLMAQIESACIMHNLPASWRGQAPSFAFELAKSECMSYLRSCAEERHFPVPSGKKTLLMIENLLSTFSVAEAYALCWSGAAGAADFKQRQQVSATHAGNAVITICQRRADQARAEGRDIKPFTRSKAAPRSALSYVFYDAFLKVGERGFTSPLHTLFASL